MVNARIEYKVRVGRDGRQRVQRMVELSDKNAEHLIDSQPGEFPWDGLVVTHLDDMLLSLERLRGVGYIRDSISEISIIDESGDVIASRHYQVEE